jgi:hypothetical protein
MTRGNRIAGIAQLVFAGFVVAALAREKDIALSEVPAVVLAAATNAVPGIKLTEAEVQMTEKGDVYEVEGIANGESVEIRISADGKDVEVGRGDD